MQFINLSVGHMFLFPRSGLCLNEFSTCLVVPIKYIQSRYESTQRDTVNITKTHKNIQETIANNMQNLYRNIQTHLKISSVVGLTQPVFVQKVAGKVESSFIAQTPLKTHFSLRHTEVSSTVMHISSLSSVVNSRNSFVSMDPYR